MIPVVFQFTHFLAINLSAALTPKLIGLVSTIFTQTAHTHRLIEDLTQSNQHVISPCFSGAISRSRLWGLLARRDGEGHQILYRAGQLQSHLCCYLAGLELEEFTIRMDCENGRLHFVLADF